MNDTRKQIIELISDYMDKSLSEGCLIEIWYTDLRHRNYWYDEEYTCFDEMIVSYNYWYSERNFHFNYDWNVWLFEDFWEDWKNNTFKILWHYDITAVLKYIDSIEWNQFIKFLIEWDKLVPIRQTTGELFWDYKLLNKPLSLYSQQEEKDLLDLLLKLK